MRSGDTADPSTGLSNDARYPVRWAAALPIGVFTGVNLLRLVMLRGTGDLSIQVDYALLPIWFWGARRLGLGRAVQIMIGAALAVVLVGGDLLDIAAHRFNWSHGVAIDYAYSMPDLPWATLLPFVAFGAVTAGAYLLPFALNRARFAIWPLVTLIGTLLLANAVLYSGTRQDIERYRLTRSFIIHAIEGVYNRIAIGRSLGPWRNGSMAKDIGSHPPQQILSVGVESFGLARAPEEQRLLIAPLMAALGHHYAIHMGAHRFQGSTLPGEIRELCALQANGIPDTPKLLAQLSSSCLPARLSRLGYDTQAIHGNGPLMYDRRIVYPAMGFNRSWFDTDLRHADANVRPCPDTAFAGVCDADVYRRALSLFDGQRRLVHVMTLDTHLPLPSPETPVCPIAFAGDAGLCRYAQMIGRSLKALGQAVNAARHPPDTIILYGDHTPPFAATLARAHFSNKSVPYVVLTSAVTNPITAH